MIAARAALQALAGRSFSVRRRVFGPANSDAASMCPVRFHPPFSYSFSLNNPPRHRMPASHVAIFLHSWALVAGKFLALIFPHLTTYPGFRKMRPSSLGGESRLSAPLNIRAKTSKRCCEIVYSLNVVRP